MTAYVVVEATVRDVAARDTYSAQVQPILKKFGAEVLSFGAWTQLFGESDFQNGMLVRFADRKTALEWFNSPEYQELTEIRTKALDTRFRLIG